MEARGGIYPKPLKCEFHAWHLSGMHPETLSGSLTSGPGSEIVDHRNTAPASMLRRHQQVVMIFIVEIRAFLRDPRSALWPPCDQIVKRPITKEKGLHDPRGITDNSMRRRSCSTHESSIQIKLHGAVQPMPFPTPTKSCVKQLLTLRRGLRHSIRGTALWTECRSKNRSVIRFVSVHQIGSG